MRRTSVLLAMVAVFTTGTVFASEDAYVPDDSRASVVAASKRTDWSVMPQPPVVEKTPASNVSERSQSVLKTVQPGPEGSAEEGQQEVADGDAEICDQCGGVCSGHGGRRAARRNQADNFNCGCNGSYKFPVPPLYTYHWPGLYSHRLMTDYHSPWRFPGLRPYKDEKPFQAASTPNSTQPASHAAPLPVTERTYRDGVETLSSKMRRYYAR